MKKSSARSGRLTWSLGLVGISLVLVAVTILLASSPSRLLPAPATGNRISGGPATNSGVVGYGQVDLEHGLTSLYPLQPGRVAEVLVQENQWVPAGKVLVRLDEAPARSKVAEAQAAVAAAQAQLAIVRRQAGQQDRRVAIQQAALAAMRHRLEAARQLLIKEQRLHALKLAGDPELAVHVEQVKELENLVQVEDVRLRELQQHDSAQDILRAEKEVALMQARLEQAELGLAECQVKAPRAGTVLRLQVGPGDVFGSNTQSPSILFAADGPSIVRAEVEQEFISRVAVGQPALVMDDVDLSTNPTTWAGRVEQVGQWFGRRRTVVPDPLALNDVLTVECLIKLDPGQPPLRIGQRMRVVIRPADSLQTVRPSVGPADR